LLAADIEWLILFQFQLRATGDKVNNYPRNPVPQSERRSDRAFVATIKSKMPMLLDSDSVAGAAVALIRNGEVVWTEGFGWADVAGRIRVTPETIFNVGSLSKTPTAWAVMQLVQEGKIGLDQPIDTYLTRWHLPPSAFDSKQVTGRRLHSHTSGISNHNYHGWDPASPLPPIEDSLVGKTGTGKVQIVFQPGSGFHYSGANFVILELLLEEQSGQPFEDYMQSHMFQPLHMNHTQYGLPSGDQNVMATPYDSLGKPLPILRYNELAAAGLTSTWELTTMNLRLPWRGNERSKPEWSTAFGLRSLACHFTQLHRRWKWTKRAIRLLRNCSLFLFALSPHLLTSLTS
jgi:CubicO group peptidase (beta-lactamase class C family)